MRQKLWIITIFTSLFLIGCSKTVPDFNAGSNVNGVDSISGDTVSIDESNYSNEKYNSSGKGFHSIYFDFGAYTIASKMEEAMYANIQSASNAHTKIKIEGNCDEFGTDEYNYALGLKRAKAVRDMMLSQGISSNKMIMVSFGESSPVCTEASDSCYDRNRRVDIRLVK
ncbi:Outer membrane lipoprotein omp16 precursor [hydrothermal vent metagenome]|uniref:Outer membrane lipoprotein omp16 n=1 Tax=hydrothermal vent metagenome TaxID=652676 RepID=A0A1W1BCS0_9ZZZZ